MKTEMLDVIRTRSRRLRGAPFVFKLLLVAAPLAGFEALGYSLFRLGESDIHPVLLELPYPRIAIAMIGVLALGQAGGILLARPYGFALYLAPFLLAYVAVPICLLLRGKADAAWLIANAAVATFFVLYGWLNRRWFGIGASPTTTGAG